MLRITVLGLVLVASLHAEHGGTAAFEKRGGELREKWGNAGALERLDAGWLSSGEGWDCVWRDDEGWAKIATATGEKSRLAEKPEDLRQGRENRSRRGRRERPAGAAERQELRLQDGRIELAGGSAVFDSNLPEGWVWSDRPDWSPDGRAFLLRKIHNVSERQVHYVRSSPENHLQPEHFTRSYPKPGDEVRYDVPVVFIAESGKRLDFDESLMPDPFQISAVQWRDNHRVWLEYIERGFGKFRLLELDIESGKSRIVAGEEDDKFLHVYEKCGWRDLGEGKLLWRSEATGQSHLYVVDEFSGERTPLTSGPWVVRGVERVNDDEIIFSLSGYHSDQDPYHVHWAKVNWKTGTMTMLTEGDGNHRLTWSPDRNSYIDSWSRVDQPPVHELRMASDGSLVAELGRADAAPMVEKGFQLPERFVAKDREGRYDILGVIWKPVDFDPAKKYAVIENIYAGPHGAFVPKDWSSWWGHKSEMNAAGFVVVQIDGRGTNYRGKEFQQYAYKNLKDSGFPDRIKWMKEAAATRPWMDLSRVGIYGGSAGGQSTLAGLLWHGDFYQAGAADCGCHDNRMDKIWWNEQWMDWPVDESYAANSNTENVSRLTGKLLLTVGEVDSNVDPSSTFQVVNALIRADKDFESYVVPNGEHGIGESPYLRRIRIEFFQRHLGGPK